MLMEEIRLTSWYGKYLISSKVSYMLGGDRRISSINSFTSIMDVGRLFVATASECSTAKWSRREWKVEDEKLQRLSVLGNFQGFLRVPLFRQITYNPHKNLVVAELPGSETKWFGVRLLHRSELSIRKTWDLKKNENERMTIKIFPRLKMYVLLKMGTFQCHVSFQGCNPGQLRRTKSRDW